MRNVQVTWADAPSELWQELALVSRRHPGVHFGYGPEGRVVAAAVPLRARTLAFIPSG